MRGNVSDPLRMGGNYFVLILPQTYRLKRLHFVKSKSKVGAERLMEVRGLLLLDRIKVENKFQNFL